MLPGSRRHRSAVEWRRGVYVISTGKSRLDFGVVHGFLSGSYWAAGVSKRNVRRRVENSLCFGLYLGEEQVGFARVVTDYAASAYLADVFVLEAHRGQGLGRWLVRCVLSHPELGGLGWRLATEDAQDFYRSFGFTGLQRPENQMERRPQDDRNG